MTRTSRATATSSRCWLGACAASSTRRTSCVPSRPCAAGVIGSRCRATPPPRGGRRRAAQQTVHSLSRRLLVSVSVPLALFFGGMMLVLDTGFRALSERSLRELLDSQMVAMIAAAEPQPSGGYAPAPHTIDPRLATPRSTLAALLHWVLAPVRRMEREIHEVEEGRCETLGAGYPRELSGVATNLNALLLGERKRVTRYRDTLGNLAHSLKTPLAVMRASLSGGAPAGPVGAEIDRMSGIIEHQLKRAAASGGALLGQAPVEVAQVASELRGTLLKVYAGKDLSLELAIAPAALFVGDRGDLTELLGNLLDNACKWCRGRVRLTARSDESAGPRERLSLIVEDDGPGISAEDRARVLERGVRADQNVPGHGLGLAMVHDTVDLYGGQLAIDASPLGGARISLRLPGR